MMALAVRQPYASAIVLGVKTVEWRSRAWKYRGSFVVCASKSPRIKLESGIVLPTGVAVGIVDIVDCRPFCRDDLDAAYCIPDEYDDHEIAGYAWVLENPREVEQVPVKGIVAPWPWKGPELMLAPGWHKHKLGISREEFL